MRSDQILKERGPYRSEGHRNRDAAFASASKPIPS